jgi:hypothetical protein
MAHVDYHQAQTKARQLFDRHGLHEWRLSVENLRNPNLYPTKGCSFMGLCDHESKTIRIHFGIGTQFRQTLLHEIAHALRGPGAGHDEQWSKIALDLGCTSRNLIQYMDVYRRAFEQVAF